MSSEKITPERQQAGASAIAKAEEDAMRAREFDELTLRENAHWNIPPWAGTRKLLLKPDSTPVMTISKDGITVREDVPVSEAAKAVLAVLDGYIKGLVAAAVEEALVKERTNGR